MLVFAWPYGEPTPAAKLAAIPEVRMRRLEGSDADDHVERRTPGLQMTAERVESSITLQETLELEGAGRPAALTKTNTLHRAFCTCAIKRCSGYINLLANTACSRRARTRHYQVIFAITSAANTARTTVRMISADEKVALET